MAFQLTDGYFSIQVTEDGYDYSMYDRNYVLLDGGVYDAPEISIHQAVKEILELEDMQFDMQW